MNLAELMSLMRVEAEQDLVEGLARHGALPWFTGPPPVQGLLCRLCWAEIDEPTEARADTFERSHVFHEACYRAWQGALEAYMDARSHCPACNNDPMTAAVWPCPYCADRRHPIVQLLWGPP